MGKANSEWRASGQLGLDGMSARCLSYEWAQEQLSLSTSPTWDAVCCYSSALILSSQGATRRRRELLSEES